MNLSNLAMFQLRISESKSRDEVKRQVYKTNKTINVFGVVIYNIASAAASIGVVFSRWAPVFLIKSPGVYNDLCDQSRLKRTARSIRCRSRNARGR